MFGSPTSSEGSFAPAVPERGPPIALGGGSAKLLRWRMRKKMAEPKEEETEPSTHPKGDTVKYILSDTAPYGFFHEDRWWSTVEHFMQAKKFEGTRFEDVIRRAPSAAIARLHGMGYVKTRISDERIIPALSRNGAAGQTRAPPASIEVHPITPASPSGNPPAGPDGAPSSPQTPPNPAAGPPSANPVSIDAIGPFDSAPAIDRQVVYGTASEEFFVRGDWHAVRERYYRLAVREKFLQNDHLRMSLIRTTIHIENVFIRDRKSVV